MSKVPGGFSAIWYSLKIAAKVGPLSLLRSLFSKNACKTCAFGMGGQKGGMKNELGEFPEICKKGLQAMVTDIQPSIPDRVFREKTVADFKKMSGRDLEHLGRLTVPLYKKQGSDQYEPVPWESAFETVAARMKSESPDRTFFYSSGRSSNEAGFLLQLVARVYGTNNLNSCAYFCHQASSVGLSDTVGTGTATILLEDLVETDLIFVIGANPSSNHPRFMKQLVGCRRRGGHVVVVNPARERGLHRFAVPSDVRSMAKGGDEIASEYVQIHIGGDIPFLKGIAKSLIESGRHSADFISGSTTGWEEFRKDIEVSPWEALCRSSGVSREDLTRIGDLYAGSRNVVFCWGMGITQHLHGVHNVRAIVNLALMRGMVGRKNAGLLPLRGHSNVQGIGTIGFGPALKKKVFERIEEGFGIRLPRNGGKNIMACMEAAERGEIGFAFVLGGNLYEANPDSVKSERILADIPFTLYINTTLNKGHFAGAGRESLVLPVLARDEERQGTTQESMFNYVRLSDGGIHRFPGLRSEVEVVAEIADRVLGKRPIDWTAFRDHANIRKAIGKVIPGLEKIGDIDETKEEFHIPDRTLHHPRFPMEGGKARFKVTPVPDLAAESHRFRLTTVRSEGQFNSIVYDVGDLYRDQKDRNGVLMCAEDMARNGFREDQPVTVTSEAGILENQRIRRFALKPGNVMMYYPEANVLIPRAIDSESGTPAFKSVLVTVEPQK